MSMKIWKYADIILLAVLMSGVFVFRHVPGAGEAYAVYVYPHVSYLLSAAASAVPFSLDEWLVVLVLLFMTVFPFAARNKGFTWRRIIWREAETVMWIFVWFYWGWGANYYRDSFYSRAGAVAAAYEEDSFRSFLKEYTEGLNSSFRDYGEEPDDTSCFWMNITERSEIETGIKEIYSSVPDRFGLISPESFQHPKYTCFNTLYSKVGVLGYMGPFFAESHVNRELSRSEYPFTYAHELSHLLGISSEAEANFWAYTVCTASADPHVRFSGYSGILPYVISNARRLMDRESFDSWLDTVEPGILHLYSQRRDFWSRRYSVFLGEIQSRIYELYLKGNNIPSGQKNYSQVIGMLLSVDSIALQ